MCQAMIDAHVHVTADLLPYVGQVRCIANADSPKEYRFLRDGGLSLISVGIHPWKADVTLWDDMEPILQKAPIIGEIGLDSEWCSVDMDVQRSVFRRQLALAAELHKPVILHTKGMEGEILETIRDYPNRYLVHWYDCEDWLQEYIDLGCWFTVGPDVEFNPLVKVLAETVPVEKLLIESDGLEGIAWGQNRQVTAEEYPEAMARHLAAVAKLRGMDSQELLRQIHRNLDGFLYDA